MDYASTGNSLNRIVVPDIRQPRTMSCSEPSNDALDPMVAPLSGFLDERSETVAVRARPRVRVAWVLLAAATLAASALIFLLGMWTGYQQRWPFHLIHRARSALRLRSSVAAVPAHLRSIDLDRTFTITSREDAVARRGQVTEVIWGRAALPLDRLPAVEAGIDDPRWRETPGVSRIDRLNIALDGGVHSVAYHFVPRGSPRSTLVIFHEGHGGDFITSRETIEYLVTHGYPVIALAMPLLGMNDRPTIPVAGGQTYQITSHNQMGLLDHPLRYFVEPVVVAVNYALGPLGSRRVAMLGVSGGGWTTTLAAAVDERIRFVFPVAGSLPIVLRAPRDHADFEQAYPPLLRVASILDLYLLGAYGEGRRQLMIYNDEDPCCFAGTRAELFRPALARRVAALGAGRVDLWVDRHAEHTASRDALDRIRESMEGAEAD